MTALKVAVVGPGAIGTALGRRLERRGAEVRYVGRGGLIGSVPVPVPVPDVVLFCVKAYQTDAALETARAAGVVSDTTALVSLQNGLGNVERIAEAFGAARTFAGATTHAARRDPETGEVRHVAEGETRIAPLEPASLPRARELSRALEAAGLGPCGVEEDARALLYRKLAVSAGINAVTALLRAENGVVRDDPDARSVAVAAAREAAVAGGLDPAEAERDLIAVASRTDRNRSSMLQDLEAGRETEVDAIHGAVPEGPVNRTLAALVRAAARTRKKNG